MKYAELNERAQARAFDKWYEGEPHDEWWDATYSDAIEVAEQLGIEIGTRQRRTMGYKTIDYPDISFSGFYSQGDGCCFSGTLRVADMAGAVEKMKAHVGEDEELHRLAAVAEDIYGQIAAMHAHNVLCDDDVNREYPECCPTMTIRIDGLERSYTTRVAGDDISPEIEKECDTFVEHFARWIYNSLEAEHDHLTSKESFEQWVEDNDPDYDEDGNPE